ncbi:MAG TPA: FecR family protein [Puia sp.]|jgi:transmembrane sensor|nr:FecR family protein [Puia sp.]
MDEQLLRNLLDKYLTGTLSDQERDHLDKLLQLRENSFLLERIMLEEFEQHRFEGEGHEQVLSLIQENILNAVHQVRKTRTIHIRRWAAAAAILILISTSYFIFYPKSVNPVTTQIAETGADIAPGGNKAILTLSNGSTIRLDSTSDGAIAHEDETNILKTDSGHLLYQKSNNLEAEAKLNTLATPRGGTFQLTLSDGTKVWLNAASSITYPSSFTGTDRKVTITGEAYFEVAKDRSKPFLVSVNDMVITVLGTHFNINAYENETQVKTTLFEGSIALKAGQYNSLLKPGEQAESGNNGKINILQQDDLNQVIAWKTGYFNFRDADLPTVMRQLERWYDIDVRYNGQVPERRFRGELPRNLTLKEVLNVLKEVKINYKIDGKMLIIYN